MRVKLLAANCPNRARSTLRYPLAGELAVHHVVARPNAEVTVKLDLDKWIAMGDAEREAAAKRVATLIGNLRFVGLERYELAGISHSIAVFERESDQFVLVPGGTGQLGYDRSCRPKFTTEQLEDWGHAECADGITLEQYLNESMAASHTIRIDPFLLEVSAKEAGTAPIPIDDPAVTELRIPGRKREKGVWTIGAGMGKSIRITKREGHVWEAVEIRPMSHRQVSDATAAEMCRLPTSDEWEYACRGTSPFLFRWGDACPIHGYPIDDTGFDLHRRPNSFGLLIAHDPYDYEFVAEPNVMRGGDGGVSICGGAGFFAGWLPLASAFVHPTENDPEEVRHGAHVRRAISIRDTRD